MAKLQTVTKKYIGIAKTNAAFKGFNTPKYIEFCEKFLRQGYKVKLYRAQKTVSKYIYISRGNKTFKVRFSNHRPNKFKEATNDCDFFVGVSNKQVTRTADAIVATEAFFRGGA